MAGDIGRNVYRQRVIMNIRMRVHTVRIDAEREPSAGSSIPHSQTQSDRHRHWRMDAAMKGGSGSRATGETHLWATVSLSWA